MTAHDFLKGLIEYSQKLFIESRLYPEWLIGTPSDAKVFYPEFIVQDKELSWIAPRYRCRTLD